MSHYSVLLLPGDGIGPEIMAEAKKILDWLNTNSEHTFQIHEDLVGGAAYDKHGSPATDDMMRIAHSADAILFGSVGGPKWDNVDYALRPEAGLLRLRKELDLFANLRPALCYPALAESSSLKPELVEGLDIMIVRELTGGVYFGEPKQITGTGNEKRAVDTQVYSTSEIDRIGRIAFDLARKRDGNVHSVEKNNVMVTGVLWKEVITRLHKEEYNDVNLQHMLADNCSMQLVRQPKQFDVIVTDNLFGDMLSDTAAMLTGSLGMLPSASLGGENDNGQRRAMYEPVHGSAPDIAGQGKANPIAMIGSLVMMLRYSFDMQDKADQIDYAISAILDRDLRTPDIMQRGKTEISTAQMGDEIIKELENSPA